MLSVVNVTILFGFIEFKTQRQTRSANNYVGPVFFHVTISNSSHQKRKNSGTVVVHVSNIPFPLITKSKAH